MDLRQLRTFVAVAEELNYGRAARRLGITEPTLSAHIRRIEREFGARLLDRGGHGSRLTPAGELLFGEARALLFQAERAEARMAWVATGQLGHLRVGFFTSLASGVLAAAVGTICSPELAITLELHETSRRHQLVLLRDGQLDLALALAPVHAADLDVQTLWHEPVVAALPEGHALAGASTLAWSDLAAERFIVREFEHDRAVFDFVHRRAEGAGFTPEIRHRVTSRESLLGLVRAGCGVGVIPESAAGLALAGVRYVQLAGRGADMTIVAARRPEPGPPNPVLRRFIGELRDAARRLRRDTSLS